MEKQYYDVTTERGTHLGHLEVNALLLIGERVKYKGSVGEVVFVGRPRTTKVLGHYREVSKLVVDFSAE